MKMRQKKVSGGVPMVTYQHYQNLPNLTNLRKLPKKEFM